MSQFIEVIKKSVCFYMKLNLISKTNEKKGKIVFIKEQSKINGKV